MPGQAASLSLDCSFVTIQRKKNSATYRSHKQYVFEKKQILIDLEDMCPLAFLNVLDFESLCYGTWETADPEAVA